MENNLTDEDMTRLKGHFQYKYGFEIDDFTAAIYNEINEGYEKISKTTDKALAELQDATSKLRIAKRQIIFQTKEVALWYALGFYIPFALTAILAFFLIYSGFIYQKRIENEKQKSDTKIEKKLTKKSIISSKRPKKAHFDSKKL